MRHFILSTLALFALAAPAQATTEIGAPAPDFTATDAAGNPFTLSDHKGKIVVLEWTNHQCPYVVKHYESGNMQATQKKAAEIEGLEWISIVSSAPGKQGHTNAEEALAIAQQQGATINAKILDESGEIGRLYGAKTTPHMFIITADGNLAYKGAIDSDSSPSQKSIAGATNYVLAALDELSAGKTVTTTETQPYGCSVKYDH